MIRNRFFSKFSFVSLFVAVLTLNFGSSAIAGISGEDMFSQCGIGAMIFPDKPTLAVISNITWDSGTTAVSSGLSDAGCSGSKMQAATLIYQKYAALELETVSGSGVHLTTLMDIFQCGEDDRADIVSGLRQDFATILSDQAGYNEASQLDKAKAYYNLVGKNLGDSCTII